MKVALVQLKSPDGNYCPNLGILYIASVLLKNGFKVKIFDEFLNPKFFSELLDYNPDVVGFTAVTVVINKVFKTAMKLKNRNEKIIVVCGGPHPTIVPEEVISNASIDYVIVKEGEYPFLNLLNVIQTGSLDGIESVDNLYYKKNGKIQKNQIAKYLGEEELNKLPYPAFDLLDLDKVFKKLRHGLYSKGTKILPIMTSRGCPNLCTFCCRIMGNKFRKRSLSSVVSEIEYMIERYGIDELYFEDDSISEDANWAKDVLNAIKSLDKRIYIKFANGIRADLIDRELLKLYKDAGGYSISFGIENGSERVLQMMAKRLDLSKVAQSVAMAKELGLKVGGNLILGYPGETPEDINKSLIFYKGLQLDSSAVVNLIPFPRTAAYSQAKRNGWLTKEAKNYNNYYFRIIRIIPLISTPYLSSFELRYYIIKAYISLYFNKNSIKTYLHYILNKRKEKALNF